MRIYWIVSSTFHRFLPCILVHLTHGYRLRKSGGAYLPHLLVIKDVNTGHTAVIIPIHDHFRLITTQSFLLITMRVFLCLVLLGIIGELVYKTMWKANRRVENNQGQGEQGVYFIPFYRLEFHVCQVELYPHNNSILNSGKTTTRNR